MACIHTLLHHKNVIWFLKGTIEIIESVHFAETAEGILNFWCSHPHYKEMIGKQYLSP